MTDDTTIEPEAADEASDAEAPADAAPVGAGLANEWTGGEPMSGRPETETGSADVEVLDEGLARQTITPVDAHRIRPADTVRAGAAEAQ